MALIVKRHKVRSRSQKQVVHEVEVWEDGFMTCSCIGFAYRRTCAHIKFITKKYYAGGQTKSKMADGKAKK